MLLSLLARGSCLLLALGLGACGGKPPAASPEPSAPKPPAKDTAGQDAKKPAEPEPPKEAPRARKPAKDFLMVTGWDFQLAFRDSDLHAKAEEQCTKKAKGDEAAAKDCVAQAAAEAANDRLKLAPDDKGGFWLIYMGKPKGKEVLYTKLQYKLEKDEPDRLVLTPIGQDQGKQAIKKLPKEIVLEMPDEYAVVWQHPERGKLVFAVKVSGEGGGKPVGETGKP